MHTTKHHRLPGDEGGGERLSALTPDGRTAWSLDLGAFARRPTFIRSRHADAPTPELLSA